MNTVLDAPVATTAKPPASLLDPGRRAQWQGVNRVPFVFEHRLAHHPLFTIPRLARLAELAIAKGDRNQYVSDEDMLLSKADRTRRQLDDIARLAEGKHWLKIASVNKLDPEYDDLLQTMMAEIEVLAEARFRDVVSWSGLTVFMNSPHLEVPYHFDHDTNFLMQVQGEKDVYLFDPDDRTVLTEAEIEDF